MFIGQIISSDAICEAMVPITQGVFFPSASHKRGPRRLT